MKLTKTSGASIAMTAAALIASGAALIATANAETFKGRCFGVNGCAGKGAEFLPAVKPPFLGFGLGLRPQHYAEILNGSPEVDWFEVLSENCMVEGGQPLRMLDRICT